VCGFFVARISGALAEWRTISVWKIIFFSYQAGGGHPSPTIIAITDPKYREKIVKLNAEVSLKI
jgi:hypothetical protein